MRCDGRRFWVQKTENRRFGHDISHIEHQKTTIHMTGFWTPICGEWVKGGTILACKMHRFDLQNAPFCVAKLALLECKTHHFALQNWHFWNAKRTILESDDPLMKFWRVRCLLIIRYLYCNRVAVSFPSLKEVGRGFFLFSSPWRGWTKRWKGWDAPVFRFANCWQSVCSAEFSF